MGFNEDGSLQVQISQRSGNTLTVEDDGLYAQAVPGQPGSTGTGYPDGYRSVQVGVKTGDTFPDSTDSAPRRIVGPKILHRVYTATDTTGVTLTDLRSVDILYPGDLYRVRNDLTECWDYYVITKTDGRTVVSHSSDIANIPFNNSDIN